MCRPATARAVTVGGTVLAVVVGLSGWVTSSSAAPHGRSAVVNLTGGVEGTGHPAMSAAMGGMGMAAARPDPAQGAYLHQTPSGRAYLNQSGSHLTGWVRVTGLPPGSHHAEGLLGPSATCSRTSEHAARFALALPDLVANVHGVAYVRLDLTVHHPVTASGDILTVDRDPTVGEIDSVGVVTSSAGLPRSFTADPAVLCGRVSVS